MVVVVDGMGTHHHVFLVVPPHPTQLDLGVLLLADQHVQHGVVQPLPIVGTDRQAARQGEEVSPQPGSR